MASASEDDGGRSGVHIGAAARAPPPQQLSPAQTAQLDAFLAAWQERLHAAAGGRPVWVALAGIPGAGKSTLAALVAAELNARGVACLAVPMDGYHLPKKALDAMPDPAEAHHRRGAPFTFDAAQLLEDVRTCQASTAPFGFPSWDHAAADPGPRDIVVDPSRHRVVLLEGNYLLLTEPEPWPQLAALCDETWFLDADIDLACERACLRNAAAFGWTLERTMARVQDSDRRNMEQVQACKPAERATRVFSPSPAVASTVMPPTSG